MKFLIFTYFIQLSKTIAISLNSVSNCKQNSDCASGYCYQNNQCAFPSGVHGKVGYGGFCDTNARCCSAKCIEGLCSIGQREICETKDNKANTNSTVQANFSTSMKFMTITPKVTTSTQSRFDNLTTVLHYNSTKSHSSTTYTDKYERPVSLLMNSTNEPTTLKVRQLSHTYGGNCEVNDDCFSGFCNQMICAHDSILPNYVGGSGPCQTDDQCFSGYCYNLYPTSGYYRPVGICASDSSKKGKVAIGGYCKTDHNCISNFCQYAPEGICAPIRSVRLPLSRLHLSSAVRIN